MTLIRKLKKIVSPFSKTPLHPQWFSSTYSQVLLNTLNDIDNNTTVLDIGCYSKWPQKIIPSDCAYIGLDYYETAKNWYHSEPDIYGDALNLPIKTHSVDTVLLLDVLEHLPDTNKALSEINQALKKNGKLIIQVPFLYPLHDEPRDYFRFSQHAFSVLAKNNNFKVIECKPLGHPIETAAQLTNLALVKLAIKLFVNKNPAMIIAAVFPVLILLINVLAKILSLISYEDQFMPHSYHVILQKNS